MIKIFALRIVAPPKAYRVSGMERQRKCGKPDRSFSSGNAPCFTHQHFSAPASCLHKKWPNFVPKFALLFAASLRQFFLLSIDFTVAQQIILNELPSLRGVFAHVEREQLGNDFELADFHRREADCVWRDEVLELAGVDFAQAFEPAGLA